jgi:hypothetical protein
VCCTSNESSVRKLYSDSGPRFVAVVLKIKKLFEVVVSIIEEPPLSCASCFW